jgi:RNA polymerase sigma factor (TIGR02999 family)
MSEDEKTETTLLLRAWAEGDANALGRLTPRVYDQLRRIAGRLMLNERPGQTLQATALVHEAYLRLIDVKQVDWQHRAHFLAVSARMMRRILIEAARQKNAGKRGGDFTQVAFDHIEALPAQRSDELTALDDALEALAKVDPRRAQVVELRFFGGLTVEETAEVLKISPETVQRDWKLARAWLLSEIS